MTKDSRNHLKGNRNFTINLSSRKLMKLKRNIRPNNLYLKFLKKNLKNCISQESLIAMSKIWKKTWDSIEEVIGKTKAFKNSIPKGMVIDGIGTFDPNKIANGFNKFFTEIGSKLASLQSKTFPKIL